MQRFLQELATYAGTVIDNFDEEDPVIAPSSRQNIECPDVPVPQTKELDPTNPTVVKRKPVVDSPVAEADETSDLELTVKGSKALPKTPSTEVVEIVIDNTPHLRLGSRQQALGQVARRLPDQKAIEAATAARTKLSIWEKRSLDDQLATLIRGRKSLKNRLMGADFKAKKWEVLQRSEQCWRLVVS